MGQMSDLACEIEEQSARDGQPGEGDMPSAADTATDAAIESMAERDDVADYAASGPAFSLEGIDDDIIGDLAAVGITIRSTKEVGTDPSHTEALVDSAAQRATIAALYLRLAGESNAEIERHKAAMMLQVELITAHYERLMAPAARRRDGFLRQVENLALIAGMEGDFGKRKKSAETPFGSFGYKDTDATVALDDSDALCKHLVVEDPTRIRVIVKLPLDEAREYLNETELAETKMEPLWGEYKKTLSPDGELPPGVKKVAAARTPFAKPMQPFTASSTH